MRVTEIIETRGKPTLSFELFPAQDPKSEKRLGKALDQLIPAEPDFVSVTFGAGGSRRESSYELVKRLKQDKKLEVLAYFAGYGLGPDQIVEVVDGFRDLGAKNLLVIRGDQPRDPPDYQPHPDALTHASDMLAFIRERNDFCLGAACYPEGHQEAESAESDWQFLKLKQEQGAQFLIAQYFYDNEYFFEFRRRCEEIGITIPIIPGVMPVYNLKLMQNLAEICGVTITNALRAGLADLPEGDKDALSDFGIDFAYEQCRGLLEAGVPGLHFYTMDRSKSVLPIVKRLRQDRLL